MEEVRVKLLKTKHGKLYQFLWAWLAGFGQNSKYYSSYSYSKYITVIQVPEILWSLGKWITFACNLFSNITLFEPSLSRPVFEGQESISFIKETYLPFLKLNFYSLCFSALFLIVDLLFNCVIKQKLSFLLKLRRKYLLAHKYFF